MVAFCVLWALPGQPSEERPRGPSLVRSAGSSRAGVVLLRMVTAILHCGLRDRGECLLQRGAIGVGCPLDVLVGDVHPGFAHVVMSAHAAAVQTHVRLLSFDGVGDRPRPGANWLGARRRSFRDFALVCGERGENLALLPRRHLEGVEATPEFGRDLVELIRGDVQFAMGLLQPQVGAPGLRRREGERPARGLAQPQGPHELEPGQAVQLPGAPFIQRVVGRPLADLPVLHDGVAEVVHHGCDGEHTTEPLVQALLSHLYVLLPISSWLARHAPVYHTVRSPSPRGSDLASASTNPESTEARRLTAFDREGSISGAGTGCPGPSQKVPADRVELADVTPPEAPQERAEGRGGLHDEAEDPRRPARLERGRVVDTVATPKGRGDEREHLVADVRPTWRLPEVEVLLDKLLQAAMLG